MPGNDFDVVIAGGGAAGIAAAHTLHDAGIRCLIVEARARLGGRAWTDRRVGYALDLGCGWLHSADRNPWTDIAIAQGQTIDKTPPPWTKPAPVQWFPADEQRRFSEELNGLFARLETAAQSVPDAPSSTLLPPGGRYNALLNAVSTYINGAELDRVSIVDFDRYDDTGINWRVTQGYGTAVAQHGADLPVQFECPVKRIDHSGKRLRIETAKGAITADQVIVTLPTSLMADEMLFAPALPVKAQAARHLPLGLADKLFLSLEGAEEFEPDMRVFGNLNSAGTGTYQFRPFGRPMIEVYYGGRHGWALEAGGERAFVDFAVSELTGVFGSGFAKRIAPLHHYSWGADLYARGSYSYAMPGHADDRAVLAAPVDGRLFFAGEACSRHDYSTAHGAYLTGVAAAEQVIAARTPRGN